MKRYFYGFFAVCLLMGMATFASASIVNGYAKVEKSSGCGVNRGTAPTWYQTTTNFVWDSLNGVYYTAQSFPVTNIDGIRIMVDCDDCELDVSNFSWWDVSTQMWRLTCDLEGPANGTWRMEQLTGICNTTYENWPGCGRFDKWGKVTYSYDSTPKNYTRTWAPYPTVC